MEFKAAEGQPALFEPLNNNLLESVNSLSAILVSPAVLSLSSSTRHIVIDTDECNVQDGGLLLQKPTGRDKETNRVLVPILHEIKDKNQSIILITAHCSK